MNMASAAGSSPMSTGAWMKFFCSAGIPAMVSGNYAVIFSEHRMQMDMLSDLNMEILKAVGINVMGDIIAILKHAKEIHTKVIREKALQSDEPVSIKPSQQQVVSKPAQKAVKTVSEVKTISLPQDLNQKKTSPSDRRTVISLKRKETERAVPTAKVRRVLPEHEGGYTIKMPVGATAKTRRILTEQGIAPKRSVFQRLGDPKVSSTTENEEGTKVTLTSTGRNVVDTSSVIFKNTSSVFDRLGPAGKSGVSSTSLENNSDAFAHPPLPYQGIFKHVANATASQGTIASKMIIKKEEATSSSRILAQDEIEKKISVLSRLGPKAKLKTDTQPFVKLIKNNLRMPQATVRKKVTMSNPSQSEGILASGVKGKTLNIRSRLGQKNRVILKQSDLPSINKQPIMRLIKKRPIAETSANLRQKLVLVKKAGNGGNILKRVRIIKKPQAVIRPAIHDMEDQS